MIEELETRAPLASPGHRLGAIAVDAGLNIVTFGIGWLIWSLITWGKGQTPGKNLLKIRVLNEPTGKPATWGQMFIRQTLLPLTAAIPYAIAYGVFMTQVMNTDPSWQSVLALLACIAMYLALWIVDIVWIFGATQRRLVDYCSGTIVVNEASK